jgi:PelA/Pel-15E family pectate lyase
MYGIKNIMKMALFLISAVLMLVPIPACFSQEPTIRPENISNDSLLTQSPEWYKSDEAMRITANVVAYQLGTGGWQKNIDMSRTLSENTKRQIMESSKNATDSTIDNDSTTLQIQFLAKVYSATKNKEAYDGLIKGLNYLFQAQYENGGWPQHYPNPTGYHAYITYNDSAMTNVLNLLYGIANDKDQDFAFLEAARRTSAGAAVNKGIDCILKTQIIVNGTLTAWCAQYDNNTLEPRGARSYEKVSISGLEGVSIVQFLMRIDNPSPAIINAVQSAAAWFNAAALHGIKLNKYNQMDDDFDFTVEKDPQAPPLWARFYEIGTNRPIFSGRDGVIKYDVMQIEQERRYNYRWYVEAPAKLLTEDYPAWQAKWAPGANVLGK